MLHVELQQIFTGHADAIYCLQKGLTDQVFYSGSGDCFVGSWNVMTGTFDKPLIKATSGIYALELDTFDLIAYVGQRGGLLYAVDLSRKRATKAVEAHQGDLFAIAIDRQRGRLLTGGHDGQLRIWKTGDLTPVISFRLSNKSIRCIIISPSQEQAAIGLSDNSIRIFDLQNLHQTAILEGHTSSVFTCLWLDEKTLVSGGRDAMMRIWEDGSSGWHQRHGLPAHLFTINHLLLSPNRQLMASASRDKTVKIWDAASLNLLKVLDRPKFEGTHTHSVNRLLWLDDHTLLSAGDDKRIISWGI